MLIRTVLLDLTGTHNLCFRTDTRKIVYSPAKPSFATYTRKVQDDLNEPRSEKTGLWDFRPGPTQTRLYSHRRWLEAWNFELRKTMDCTICVAKTKALCFAYATNRFSHDAAQII